MLITPNKMIKLLEKNGFQQIKQQGSQKMYNPITKATTIIPMHNKDLGKVSKQDILKQTGLK